MFRYRSGDVVRALTVERRGDHFVVRLDGRAREVVVRRAVGAELDLLVDGRPVRAIAASSRDGVHVRTDAGDAWILTRAEDDAPRAAAGRSGAAGDALVASMDGRIAAVHVQAGDVVEAGTTLVVLEAMKMEMRLTAPRRARVRSVACRAGEVVPRGRVLIALEAA